MSRRAAKDDDDGDGRGCVLIIGLVIVALVVGNIYTANAGWLVIGIGLIVMALT